MIRLHCARVSRAPGAVPSLVRRPYLSAPSRSLPHVRAVLRLRRRTSRRVARRALALATTKANRPVDWRAFGNPHWCYVREAAIGGLLPWGSAGAGDSDAIRGRRLSLLKNSRARTDIRGTPSEEERSTARARAHRKKKKKQKHTVSNRSHKLNNRDSPRSRLRAGGQQRKRTFRILPR